jgi:hypothetical protein
MAERMTAEDFALVVVDMTAIYQNDALVRTIKDIANQYIEAEIAATEAKVREEYAGLVERVAQLEEELGKHIDVDKEIARVERELGA